MSDTLFIETLDGPCLRDICKEHYDIDILDPKNKIFKDYFLEHIEEMNRKIFGHFDFDPMQSLTFFKHIAIPSPDFLHENDLFFNPQRMWGHQPINNHILAQGNLNKGSDYLEKTQIFQNSNNPIEDMAAAIFAENMNEWIRDLIKLKEANITVYDTTGASLSVFERYFSSPPHAKSFRQQFLDYLDRVNQYSRALQRGVDNIKNVDLNVMKENIDNLGKQLTEKLKGAWERCKLEFSLGFGHRAKSISNGSIEKAVKSIHAARVVKGAGGLMTVFDTVDLGYRVNTALEKNQDALEVGLVGAAGITGGLVGGWAGLKVAVVFSLFTPFGLPIAIGIVLVGALLGAGLAEASMELAYKKAIKPVKNKLVESMDSHVKEFIIGEYSSRIYSHMMPEL
jgi:hypothetical protein